MNIQELRNDPKFTAYAFNELSSEEAKAFKDELLARGADESAIENEVANLQLLKATLQTEFSKDQILRAAPETRSKILKNGQKKGFNWPWKSLIGGSAVAVLGVMVFIQTSKDLPRKSDVLIDGLKETSITQAQVKPAPTKKEMVKKNFKTDAKMVSTGGLATQSAEESFGGGMNKIATRMAPTKGMHKKMRMDGALSTMPSAAYMAPQPVPPAPQREAFNREGYDKIDANPYVLVSNQPLSTFSVDVDTASYANMRRFLLQGKMPPKDSLRIEELINYFPYDYKVSFKKHPVAIKVDAMQSIWNKGRKIVRIAMKSDSPSNLTNAPKNLVFLLDVSGSMNSAKKLPLLKESMKLLLRKLKKTDTISLVVYAGAAGVVLEPTPVKETVKILRALDSLNAGGSTNGGAGIIAAYKMAKLGFVKNGVNRVILATDGDFNVGARSRSAMLDLIEEKAKQDIFLTVVGLGMGNYQDAVLEEISNRGNGNYAYIDSLQEANKLFNIDLEKNLTTVAKDVKIQVEFNPTLVKAYRLIGYENRMLKAQDFNDDKKDAGEMGAGHTVTALYELVPSGAKFDEGVAIDKLKYSKAGKAVGINDELLTVKVRYKEPTGSKSKKFEVPLHNQSITFDKADLDFRFATTVASFGLKLRGDKLARDLSYRELEKMAKNAKGSDPYDFRSEFVEMIDLASQIDR